MVERNQRGVTCVSGSAESGVVGFSERQDGSGTKNRSAWVQEITLRPDEEQDKNAPNETRPVANDLADPSSYDGILDGLEEGSGGRVERRIDLNGDEFGSLGSLGGSNGRKYNLDQRGGFSGSFGRGQEVNAGATEEERKGRRTK